MAPAELTGGYLFDIQGFSVHDGPGCRTLIFFKGCPLHCAWCSNPEGISPLPEPLYNPGKCNADLLCMEACPSGAISQSPDGLAFDRLKCSACSTFDCAAACCTGALRTGGYFITTDELYAKISRDRQYWGSQGGITLTGGEPFSQPQFARELLKRCYDGYIHTAAETCGDIPWPNIESSLPFLDWIFFDLKHPDPGQHRSATGHSNERIRENARRVAAEFRGRLVYRMPVIPGFNDSDEHIREMTAFILSTGRTEINLLPVHHLGREKYSLTGKRYSMDHQKIMTNDAMLRIREIFTTRGVACYLGSDTPF